MFISTFKAIVTSLPNVNNNNCFGGNSNSGYSNNNNINNNLDKKVTIQEIGQETLEREMSREKQQKFESSKVESSKRMESPTKIQVHVESHNPDNSPKAKTFRKVEPPTLPEMSESSTKSSTTRPKASESLKVRHVPIQLEDGKIVRHDPDETMEIR
jgi:hypothetical protein